MICKMKILHMWLTSNAVLFGYIFYTIYTAKEYYYLRSIAGKGLSLSKASAAIIMFNSSLLLLLVCRNTISALKGTLKGFK